MAEKGHALHMETWLIFHVGCIEGMAEKGHTIYMKTLLALHVGCVVGPATHFTWKPGSLDMLSV